MCVIKKPVEAAEGIYLIPVPFFDGKHYTSVVLVNGTENVLIDGGDSADTADGTIIPALGRFGVKPTEVSVICATHCHGDHTRGICRLKELCGAKTAYAVNSPFKGDIAIEDGDVFAGRLRAVCTPGHSDDCVCFFDERAGTLITGDAFQACGTYGVALALINKYDDYFRSIEKAKELGAKRIVAGHAMRPFGTIIEGERETREFLDFSRKVAESYLEYGERLNASSDPIEVGKDMTKLLGHRYKRYICDGSCTAAPLIEEMKRRKKMQRTAK